MNYTSSLYPPLETAKFKVPKDLAEYPNWGLWRYEVRDANRRDDTDPTKIPYSINGRRADPTNPADWTEYERALLVLMRHPERYAGLGSRFSEADPFCGLDLDDCLEDTTGNPKHWCQGLLERFADTYLEVSPSGLGIKIWCRGKLPANVGDTPVEDGAISLWDHSRYFTVTGRAFRGAPLEIEDHAEDVLAQYDCLTNGRGASQPIPEGGKIPYGHNTSRS